MPLSLTDPEVERLTEELARRHGISKTEVIRQALRHEAARETSEEQRSEYVKRGIAFVEALWAENTASKGLPITKEFIDSLYE